MQASISSLEDMLHTVLQQQAATAAGSLSRALTGQAHAAEDIDPSNAEKIPPLCQHCMLLHNSLDSQAAQLTVYAQQQQAAME